MTNSEWREVSLGQICEFKYGKSLPASEREPGAVGVYGSNGLVGTHSSAVTNGPTIIIGRKGSFGEVSYSEGSCWPIDTTYYVDSSSTSANLRWLYYRLGRLGLKELNRAAAVPGLNREDAYRRRLLLPPVGEQRRIAEILDQADVLLVKHRKAIALLDDLARSIFRDMFMATRGNHAAWPVRNISDLCTLVVDCVNRTAPTIDGPTPYKMIRTTNVRDGRVDLANVRYVNSEIFTRWNRRATPMPGDVILTREAPVGEAGILRSNEKVFLGQRLMLYRVNEKLLTPEYLLAIFQSDFLARQFEKFGSGSTVKHLPLPACRNFKIPLPPITLQKRYESCMCDLNALRGSQKAGLRHLDELFNSLQEKAFRGEL